MARCDFTKNYGVVAVFALLLTQLVNRAPPGRRAQWL